MVSLFSRRLRAARLSVPDVVWLSGGALKEQDLYDYSADRRPLDAASYELVEQILERHNAAAKDIQNGIRLLVLSKVKARAGTQAVAAKSGV